jgi:3-dehydroquinate synthase
MHQVTVPIRDAPYQVLIGSGILDQAHGFLAGRPADSPVAVVADANVAERYAGEVRDGVTAAGRKACLLLVPPGESSKNLSELERLYDGFASIPLDRRSTVAAVGGGVIGDLAGFAAATYLRGLDLVQIPTTLLAQVDASIGGKTGVNLLQGKNLVGAFHQPRLVVADVATLRTLPPRELRSGLAEVIKYGVIADPALLEQLASERDAIQRAQPEAVEGLVVRSCQIKAEVVAADERETGRRAILNFGHTLAHALEAATVYHEYLHGEAVAIGMVAAARLSCRLSGMSPEVSRQLEELLRSYDLPVALRTPVDPARLMEAARRDKKARGGALTFVLARSPGDVDLFQVDESRVLEVLEELMP